MTHAYPAHPRHRNLTTFQWKVVVQQREMDLGGAWLDGVWWGVADIVIGVEWCSCVCVEREGVRLRRPGELCQAAQVWLGCAEMWHSIIGVG